MSSEDFLLRQVNDDRDKRCAALRDTANQQARQIVRSARTAARKSVEDAATQERTRMDLGLRQASARAEIEARRLEQRQSRELLGEMWERIAVGLERRWTSPTLRRAWIDAAMSQAAALLSGRAWRIECAAGFSNDELAELTTQAREHGATAVEWSLNTSTPAGLMIRAEGASVDATIPGLLAQREMIEAAFLAEYHG